MSVEDRRRRPRLTATIHRVVYAELVGFAEKTPDPNVSRIVELALVEFLRARGVVVELSP